MRIVNLLSWRKSFVFPLGLWLLAILLTPVMVQLLDWLVARAFPPTIYDVATMYPWRLRRTLVLVGGLSVAVAWFLDGNLRSAMDSPGNVESGRSQPHRQTTGLVALTAQVADLMGQATRPAQLLLAVELALDMSFVAMLALYEHALFGASVGTMIGLNPMVLVEPLILALNSAFTLCILFNIHPWTASFAIRIMRGHESHSSLPKDRWKLTVALLITSLLRAGAFALAFWLFDSAAVTPKPAITRELIFTVVLGAWALVSMFPFLPRAKSVQP